MKEQIRTNLTHPEKLEALYRAAPDVFKTVFTELYPEITEYPAAAFWHERLKFESEKINWGTSRDILMILGLSALAGLVVKLPEIFNLPETFFFQRNAAFIFFPFLIFYFLWKQKTERKKWVITAVGLLISLVYINVLPDKEHSNSIILACIHLPLVIWGFLGFVFQSANKIENTRRLKYLQYNGDLAVMLALLAISGILLSGITIGLFNLIEIDIREFYITKVVFCCAAAAPIIATYLIQVNPKIVNSISPLIARIFTPLVLITLSIYLIAVLVTGKDPYNDREFLLLFNILLIGVMALILFSVIETTGNKSNKLSLWILLSLSVVTIIINGVALSAIIFRISEWGITPNRLAILGSNILMLIHMILLSIRMISSLKNNTDSGAILSSITRYLPIYLLWCLMVVFLFPIMFNMA